MEHLRTTLYSIAVVAIASGVINLFSTSDKLKKYTSYAISLAITLSILSPIKNILLSPNSIVFGLSENMYEQNTAENSICVALKQAIANNISDYFSIPADSFYVDITIDQNNSEQLITSISVTIKEKKLFSYAERIEAYLKSNFGCKITVTQSLEE